MARPVDLAPARIAPALWATAGVLGAGALFDLGILWLGQREPTPQWEFMAVSNTLNAVPTLVLAVAVAYVALFVGQVTSSLGFRLLGLLLLLLGLVSGGLGAILLTDYFSLAGSVIPESKSLLRSTTAKGVMLSTLFFLLLVPTGLLGTIRPRLHRRNRF